MKPSMSDDEKAGLVRDASGEAYHYFIRRSTENNDIFYYADRAYMLLTEKQMITHAVKLASYRNSLRTNGLFWSVWELVKNHNNEIFIFRLRGY